MYRYKLGMKNVHDLRGRTPFNNWPMLGGVTSRLAPPRQKLELRLALASQRNGTKQTKTDQCHGRRFWYCDRSKRLVIKVQGCRQRRGSRPRNMVIDGCEDRSHDGSDDLASLRIGIVSRRKIQEACITNRGAGGIQPLDSILIVVSSATRQTISKK